MSRGLYRVTVFAVVFLFGATLGWLVNHFLQPSPSSFRGSLLRQTGYQFINPILACDTGSEDSFPEFKPIKETLTTLVKEKIRIGSAKDISLYVRSLKTGRWFAINPDTLYEPASLLKVFVMMAYYKESEDNSSVLSRELLFVGSERGVDHVPGDDIPHLISGKRYRVDELIHQMIVYSDNDALGTLVDAFSDKTLEAMRGIFSDLNIPSPLAQNDTQLDFMPVSSYAMVFRVLFSSTYLTRPYSEKALALLSEAEYRNGIVAGVPEHILIAHKFGVRKVEAAMAELHDCGIIYYPNHPYLLCVMTRGKDFSSLQTAIADISHAAYKTLDTYYRSLGTTSTPLLR